MLPMWTLPMNEVSDIWTLLGNFISPLSPESRVREGNFFLEKH